MSLAVELNRSWPLEKALLLEIIADLTLWILWKSLKLGKFQESASLFMASVPVQCPVPHRVLMQLHQFVISTFDNESDKPADQIRRSRPHFKCPHQYYPSNEMYVEHLVWFVQQNAECEHYIHHLHVIGAFMTFTYFCGRCRDSSLTCDRFHHNLWANL